MEQASSEHARSYFRVETRIGLRVHALDPDRWEAESRAILEDRSRPLQGVDPELASWLDRIERKLDRLLEATGSAASGEIAHTEFRDVVLSGSGIRLGDASELEVGQPALLELELPVSPVVRIRCLGTVAREEGAGEDREVAVRFDVIREADRDRIVQYTLEVQRTELRVRSGGSVT